MSTVILDRDARSLAGSPAAPHLGMIKRFAGLVLAGSCAVVVVVAVVGVKLAVFLPRFVQ